jgi:hypothetical protein
LVPTFIKLQEIPMFNPDLKSETVSSQEIGVELNAFTNRLHFEGTYLTGHQRPDDFVNRAQPGVTN